MELEQLDLKQGESIIITANGSIEKSIIIYHDGDGNIHVEGPRNCNHQAIIVSVEGIHATRGVFDRNRLKER